MAESPERAVVSDPPGGSGGHGPDPSRQFPRRESQQPITQLLFPASPDRPWVPGAAAVLPESPAFPPQRPARTSGQESRRTPDGADASALAGVPRLHEIPPQLTGPSLRLLRPTKRSPSDATVIPHPL